ncbi:MAG TPA: glycosyltransferase family 2 protein [Polyangiales bacterium]
MGPSQRLDVSVVLPTFNESASLPVLVPRIAAALSQAGLDGEIIVVDDNSPDGTADVARELAGRYPVRVLKRTDERGLATAVLRGFAMSEAEVVVVMDADGSHPVEALGNMVRLILTDKAQLVVGSRHVPGGGSKDWPLFSRFKSRFAASLTLGLTSMTDPTTGFMAIRRSLLPGLALDPVGWKIVLEIVVKASPVRLAEVPIVFTDREHGESKQSVGVLMEYFKHLYKLYKFRFPALVEFLKFCLVGGFGLVVDLSIVSLLKELGNVDTRLCQVFGFAAAVTFNYAVNRRFSFEGARETPVFSSYFAYLGANLVGLTLRMLVIHALMGATALDQGRGYLLLSVIGIVIATLVNFFGVKYFAFAKPRPSEGEAPELVRPSMDPGAGDRRLPRPGVAASVALLACAALMAGSALSSAPRTHDEQVNLTMADNMRRGFDGVVHPATISDFAGDWQRDALPALGNTPVYPLLLALFAPGGERGLDLLGALILGLALLGVYAAVAPVSGSAARVGVLITASSPWLLTRFALREFEPLLAALGALAFAALIRAKGRRATLWAGGAGALLGLGFAVKMWLVLPALFAALGFLLARVSTAPEAQRRRLPALAGALIAGFVLLGSAHLVFVALVAPRDLGAWLEWVYLGLFSGRGVSAAKLSASSEHTSSWAYLLWLIRDHGAFLVPLALGLPSLTRRLGTLQRAWFTGVGFALLALVPLSVPAGKEPLYMLPALPFLYGFVALAITAPDYTPARFSRIDRAAAKFSLLLAALLLAYWAVALGGAAHYARLAPLLHLAHVALWTAPSFRVLRQRPVKPVLAGCALVSLALAITLLCASPGPFDS